jgi:selenocysteine lyase/cysteine desulfurase
MSDFRSLFHVPGPGPYLLSHSVGSLPRRARGLLTRDLLAPWMKQGSDAWPLWLAAVDRFRAALAGLIGANVTEICPQPSVSAGVTNLLSGLRREPRRNKLLTSAHSFPSIGYALSAFERLGLEVEFLPEAVDPGDAAAWTAALDHRVAAVVAMHVHSNSGRISPVAEIAASARTVGALSIIDVCQSTGVVPVDAHAWGADAIVGSCVKWLCGGSGAGFLWVRQALIAELEPLAVGWFSHENPFEFDIRDFRYSDDARRFWGGSPSIAPFVLATAGIETIAGIGQGQVMAHNRKLIEDFAVHAGIELNMVGRGGTLCLTSADTEAAIARLDGARCRYDRRGDVIRLSFHAWNTVNEAQRVGAAVQGLGLQLV